MADDEKKGSKRDDDQGNRGQKKGQTNTKQTQNKGNQGQSPTRAKGQGQNNGNKGGNQGQKGKGPNEGKTPRKDQDPRSPRNEKNEEKEENEKKDSSRNEDQDQEDESNNSSGNQTSRESKKKEYFKEELKRLKESLQKEADKINPPPKKEYTPYTFTTLEPYFNVYTAEFIMDQPDEVRHGYVNRQTAIGLCDPWVDHTMDVELLPKIDSRPVPQDDDDSKKKKKDEKKNKEGSTRLPKMPTIKIDKEDMNTTKKIPFNEVPAVREYLKGKYSHEADKVKKNEYKRTKDDFYRMELDKLEEYHPVSRPNMRKTYFAYLQNNPGSRQAVYDCMKDADEKLKEKEEEDKKEKEKEKEREKEEKEKEREREKQNKRQSRTPRDNQQKQPVEASA